jgi:hypothetical protein
MVGPIKAEASRVGRTFNFCATYNIVDGTSFTLDNLSLMLTCDSRSTSKTFGYSTPTTQQQAKPGEDKAFAFE